MMRNLCLLFMLIILLSQCSRKGEVTVHDGINRMDTTVIIPDLKTILRQYIKAHPQFQNFSMDGVVLLKEQYHELNANDIYLLGPTSMLKYGESYGGKRLYPSTCFVLDGKLFFLSSSNDKLAVQSICKKIYLNHLEIDEKGPLDKSLFWLIKVSDNGSASILSTNMEEYTGVEKVKKPSSPSLFW